MRGRMNQRKLRGVPRAGPGIAGAEMARAELPAAGMPATGVTCAEMTATGHGEGGSGGRGGWVAREGGLGGGETRAEILWGGMVGGGSGATLSKKTQGFTKTR